MSTIVLIAFNGTNGSGPPGLPLGVVAAGALAGDRVLQVLCIGGSVPGIHLGTQNASIFGSVIPSNDIITQNWAGPTDYSGLSFLAVLSRG